ncbi:MAG: hypothetical protein HC905_11395 [Bacteroidales bacterium]|nr:hypothetical protein [Bacteroidales bacterium]
MATAGKEIYALQYDALQRANSIILPNKEMEEILLSKFGRNLKIKIKYALFGLEKEYVNNLIYNRSCLRNIGENILKKNGFELPKYKYVLKIGYNAFESQNHIKILHEISKLQRDILNILFLYSNDLWQL